MLRVLAVLTDPAEVGIPVDEIRDAVIRRQRPNGPGGRVDRLPKRVTSMPRMQLVARTTRLKRPIEGSSQSSERGRVLSSPPYPKHYTRDHEEGQDPTERRNPNLQSSESIEVDARIKMHKIILKSA